MTPGSGPYRGIVFAVACFATTATAGSLPERVRNAVQERVDAGEYPAVVVGYIADGKSEVDAFGKLDDGKAPDADTVFEIGSITKTFTATLLAEAVESGAVKIDTPVASLLPDFKIPERSGKRITLLDIATQHSGLPRLPSNLAPADPANPYADYDAARLKAFLSGYTLTRDPGASYEYSNLAFGLLGFALARHAHSNYAQLVDRKILRPLQMASTGIGLTDAILVHLAPGHDGDGKSAKNWDIDALAGAGALRSSTTDMLHYLRANMEAPASPLGRAMKFAQEPRQDTRGKITRIGLAWMTVARPGGDVIWHNGGTGGYRSFLGFNADRRRGVVVMTNSANDVDQIGFAALDDDSPLAPTRKVIVLDAGALDDYVGVYKFRDHFLVNMFRHDDRFFTQATGQTAFRLYPSAPNEFFARDADISLSFKRDAQGKVTGLILHQNGDHDVPKLDAAQIIAETGSVVLVRAVLRDYVGSYQLDPKLICKVTLDDDQVMTQLTGQPAVPIYAKAKDRFAPATIDARIDFERDGEGKVVALVLHHGGADTRAPRVGE